MTPAAKRTRKKISTTPEGLRKRIFIVRYYKRNRPLKQFDELLGGKHFAQKLIRRPL